jgi:hypothetical protein
VSVAPTLVERRSSCSCDDLGAPGQKDRPSAAELADITERLAQRWFLMRNVHSEEGTLLMQPRWAMSLLRGPMTASEIKRARELGSETERVEGAALEKAAE